MATRFCVLLLFVCLVPKFGLSQLILRGHVYGGEKQEPLPYASVFLAGTSKGTVTDATGTFELPANAGNFDLVVSYVGYTTLKIPVNTQEKRNYKFILKPLNNELMAVTVKAHRKKRDWSREIALFTANFIGITENASQCRLLNPNVLQFADSQAVFRVTAQEPLLIENKALGYRIKYQLKNFTYNYETLRIGYEGDIVFEPLTPTSTKESEEWSISRRRVYLGSVMHFMRSLYRRRLAEEGFVIQQVIEKKNRVGERRLIGLPTDSTAEYPSLAHPKKWITFPKGSYKLLIDSTLSTANHPVVSFPDWIQVIYAMEREPTKYQTLREVPENKYKTLPQRSFLRMLQPSVTIESDGRFDLQAILFEGYWTWELVADSLPTDYEP